jgi:hypothetical protein
MSAHQSDPRFHALPSSKKKVALRWHRVEPHLGHRRSGIILERGKEEAKKKTHRDICSSPYLKLWSARNGCVGAPDIEASKGELP